MNDYWYWRLAQERQRELLEEANDVRRLREAGVREAAPGAVKALGLLLLALPFVVLLVRAIARL